MAVGGRYPGIEIYTVPAICTCGSEENAILNKTTYGKEMKKLGFNCNFGFASTKLSLKWWEDAGSSKQHKSSNIF